MRLLLAILRLESLNYKIIASKTFFYCNNSNRITLKVYKILRKEKIFVNKI